MEIVACSWIVIPVGRKYAAKVDATDAELIAGRSWHFVTFGGLLYAQSGKSAAFPVSEMMHRLLMQPGPGMVVDHKNGDGLDNRRHNLRVCTRTQNQQNRRKIKPASSKYKGVYWSSGLCRWRVEIKVDGKKISGGSFSNEEDAAKSYDELATKHFGEFARLNLTG
jgi:hypothetical protein